MIGMELDKAGMTEEDLTHRRKGDPWKMGVAARLRHETTMSLKWIAVRLKLGS